MRMQVSPLNTRFPESDRTEERLLRTLRSSLAYCAGSGRSDSCLGVAEIATLCAGGSHCDAGIFVRGILAVLAAHSIRANLPTFGVQIAEGARKAQP